MKLNQIFIYPWTVSLCHSASDKQESVKELNISVTLIFLYKENISSRSSQYISKDTYFFMKDI